MNKEIPTTLRVLIADDEELSRKRLRHLLGREPKTEIVAECSNGLEAFDAIQEQSPDLVFLDVKMPELDGFGVLRKLEGTRLPVVVFVTAYDQFAVRAFDLHAVDYLIKPFDRERFQLALSRARHRLQGNAVTESASLLSKLLTSIKTVVKTVEYLPVKSGSSIKLLKVEDIDWISSADNYVELQVGGVTHLSRITMTALARQLPKSHFARISRSLIVNLNRIEEIRGKSHGDFIVLLQAGTRLEGTRTYRQNLMGKAQHA